MMILVVLPPFYFNRNFNSVIGNLSGVLGLILMFFIVDTIEDNKTRKTIYTNNKLLIPFSAIFLLHVSYLFLVNTKAFDNFTSFLYRIGLNIPGYYDLFCYLVLLVSFISIYLFGIRFSNFNWDINKKEFKGILLASIVRHLPFILVSLFIYKNGALTLPKLEILSFIAVFIRTFLYPAFYEEFLYRGLFFSLLGSYNISFNKINIIQAVVFGLIHVFNFGNQLNMVLFLFTGAHVIAGYTLGLLYQKTKSLTPCILLHTLIDIYFNFLIV